MGVKSLMARLQSRAADTPDTLKKIVGYLRKANIHEGCTPDTPDTSCLSDTYAIFQTGSFAEAVNDPSPPPEPPADPNAWRELAKAYHDHHFVCGTCIAAGRSPDHGTRCCEGSLLWDVYQRGATSPLDAPTDISLEVTA